MKHRSKVRTDNSRRVRSYPLRLELLEDRLPPGDLVGSSLLGGAWLTSSHTSSVATGEPRPATPIVRGERGAHTTDSPAAFVTSEGRNLVRAETERPVAESGVGWSAWTAREPVAGLWGDPLRPTENSRSRPLGFSRPEEWGAGNGSTQRLADAGPGAFFPETSGGARGNVAVASSAGLEGQAWALTLVVQQSPASLDPGTGGSRGAGPGPESAGELSVVATYPWSNAVGWPADWPVIIQFNKPVDPSSLHAGTFAVFGRNSGMLPGWHLTTEDGIYAVFLPERPFIPGETVDVMLTHDIKAADGGTLRYAGYALNFWVPAGAGGGTTFPEAARLDTGTNVRTYGGAATDLNADGWVDIAVVNEIAADLRVFMNNGDGSYGGLSRYPIRRGASPTVWGDFNRDGFTDLASSNYDDNSMSVVLGNGDGTFRTSQTYPTGNTPAGITALDVNGDGAVELAVVNAVSSTVLLFSNNGDGTFTPGVPLLAVPGAGFYGVTAADMNNDGVMDLVVGAQYTRRVYVLLGDGGGWFYQSANVSAGGGPWVLRAADVNGDTYADVQVANNAEGNMAILFGDGAGGLSAPTTYRAGSRPVSVTVGDLNGDGSLDVVISNFSSRDYNVFTNDGAGGFTQTGLLRARQSGSCAIIFDYNRDGLLDIGAVDELEDEIILFVNNG